MTAASSSPEEDARALAEVIGVHVRDWRAERGWTLDVLAERSSVSRRTLIAIEQGQSNPSVGVLVRLSTAFGVSLSALVEENSSAPLLVHRNEEAPALWRGSSGGTGVLVGSTQPPNVAEHWRWTMQPGDSHRSEPHSTGTREIILVHEGALDVYSGGTTAELAFGDSVVLFGDQAHGYACRGDSAVIFTMTVLQPGVGGRH